MDNTEKIKEIGGWEISLSREDRCIVFNTIDYHPRMLRLTEADLRELLDRVTREGTA